MGRGRDAGSGVLAWRTHRLEIKVDQAQYGRVGVLWGGAIFPSWSFFVCFVKVYQAPPYLIKKSLKSGEKSKFEVFVLGDKG